MSLLNLIQRKPGRRVVVLGLDGVSYDQIINLCNMGVMPRIKKLFKQAHVSKLQTVSPAISPVSWTTCITGVNPARHGIYGYMERRRNSYGTYFPNGLQVASRVLWDPVSDAGKRTVAINVPNTYPAKEIRGVLISGFDSLDFNKAVYPDQLCSALQKTGYRIDVDINSLKNDRGAFYAELLWMLKKRREAIHYFIQKVDWKLFFGVITGTGRINRYLWNDYLDKSSGFHEQFINYFKEIDALTGEIISGLAKDTDFILMSDHGTQTLNREFYVNTWLKNEGFLKFKTDTNSSFEDIDPQHTQVFALDNGRIYINLKGTLPDGCVEHGKEYEKLRMNLIERLLTLKDESIGTPFISAILRKEDIYDGLFIEKAPDLILEGINGYEIRGDIDQPVLFGQGRHEGVSKANNAFFCMKGIKTLTSKPGLIDIYPTVLDILNIPCEDGIDGMSII